MFRVSVLNIFKLLLIALAVKVAATEKPPFDIANQIELLSEKIDQLQLKLDLFDYYNSTGSGPTFVRLEQIPSNPPSKPASCKEAFDSSIGNGVYKLHLPESGLEPFNVYCWKDPEEVIPWTLVQRRVDNGTDFYRDWDDYKRGFGDLTGNFFIGLEKLHALANGKKPQELWIQLQTNRTAYAKYNRFTIGDEYEQYALKVLGTYTGTAGDSLSQHVGMKFSTRDADNDIYGNSCATQFRGAWWYQKCHSSHLNGVYGSTKYAEGVIWNSFEGLYIPMKYAHMAVRPARS